LARRRNVCGHPIYQWVGTCLRRGVMQCLAGRGEYCYVVHQGEREYTYARWPWSGTYLISVGVIGFSPQGVLYVTPLSLEVMRMRRLSSSGSSAVPSALPRESKVLVKLPLLCEFLSATAYEDGTKREPGYFTMRNRGHCYEATAYDPDSGLRLPVRGPNLDHVFAALEQLLGTAEAPWEVDDYLMSRVSKKKRK